jgi:hypothetical protein
MRASHPFSRISTPALAATPIAQSKDAALASSSSLSAPLPRSGRATLGKAAFPRGSYRANRGVPVGDKMSPVPCVRPSVRAKGCARHRWTEACVGTAPRPDTGLAVAHPLGARA